MNLGQLVLLYTCGLFIKNNIFIDQIKFFHGQRGASLDEEGCPMEGIYP